MPAALKTLSSSFIHFFFPLQVAEYLLVTALFREGSSAEAQKAVEWLTNPSRRFSARPFVHSTSATGVRTNRHTIRCESLVYGYEIRILRCGDFQRWCCGASVSKFCGVRVASAQYLHKLLTQGRNRQMIAVSPYVISRSRAKQLRSRTL